ncbi:MAG: hypothetical protein ACJ788_19510, partial [Ktedonobacteraceae bacterium]
MHLDKSVIGFGTFFLIMAIIVPPGLRAHWGMQGIFLAMTAALMLSFLATLGWGKMREKMRGGGIKGRELAGFMVGYAPKTNIVESNKRVRQARADEMLSLNTLDDDEQVLVPVAIDHYENEDYEDKEGLPNVIIEVNGMYLSDTYQPGIDSMLGQTILFCGIRRSGKSNGMAVVAEEQARYYVPLVIGDTEDEYGPLADHQYMPRGVMAGSMDLLEAVHLSNYIAIDLNGAYEFGKTVLSDALQVVLNLKSFADDDEAAMIMCEIIAGMNDWESSRPNAQRVPCMFMLDEANKWLPQNERESYVSKEVLTELQKAFFGTMVRRGGKRGLGLALTTQRIVELDKRALQSTWKFLFRQTEQIDIERYKALGLDGDAVQALRQGECFVFSPGVIGFPMYMRQRHSPHLAHTPGLDQLRAHIRSARPVDMISGSFVENMHTRAEGSNTPTADAQAQQLLAETSALRPRPQSKLDRALAAWNAGHQSVRALAVALSTER